jgi:hypothetical protein
MMYGPGVHEITADAYHSDPTEVPSLSASIAKILVNSTPMHAKAAHPRLNPNFERVEEEKFDVGNIAHSLILEGNADKLALIEADDWRKKETREERDAARTAGLIPLLAKDYQRVETAVAAIRTQLMARDIEPALFTDGKPEQMIVWEERGVTCRALVDWLRDDFLAVDDLKTTSRSANPVLWANRTLWSIGADVQYAFNRRGVKAVTGKEPEFRFVLAETTPPFAIGVVSLAPSANDLAEVKVDRALERWRECMENDDWPGYPEATYYAEAPAWAELQFLELDGEALNA